MNLKFIYKIINIDELKKAKSSGTYSGSSKDIQDGYIHFSGEDQVEGTLKKYYANQKKSASLGGLASKEANAYRIEYKGKIYLGWGDFTKATGVSKHNYKKYYLQSRS